MIAPSPMAPSRTDITGARSSFAQARWNVVNRATSYVALATPITTIAASATSGSGTMPMARQRQAPEHQADDLRRDQPLGSDHRHREDRAGEPAQPERGARAGRCRPGPCRAARSRRRRSSR